VREAFAAADTDGDGFLSDTDLRANPHIQGYCIHKTGSRHLRALLSVCGGCSFGGWGVVFLSCVCVGGVVLCRSVCVCDRLIFTQWAKYE